MKRIFTILATLLFTTALLAQTPSKISYQAVLRTDALSLVTNASVGMQISILQGSVNGTAVFVERHFPVTNGNGLVSLEINTGTVVSGDFETIDWSDGPYFIKTETDLTGGSNYTISGTTQLLSVPYAFHAETAANVFTGDYNDLENKPMTLRSEGDYTVFAGKNAGVNSTGPGNSFYGDNAGAANTYGEWNTFIGSWTGISNTTGSSNTFVGDEASRWNISGSNNVSIGTTAGLSLETGNENTSVGGDAGYNNVSGNANVFLGFRAGYDETGSNKLYISNTMTEDPLIYGEFDNQYLKFNGHVEVDGKVSRAETGSDNNLLASAYGNVADDGTKNTGTDNFTVTHASTGTYYIDWEGDMHTYYNEEVVNVTAVSGPVITSWTSTNGGATLMIELYDTDGNKVDADFSFSVFVR